MAIESSPEKAFALFTIRSSAHFKLTAVGRALPRKSALASNSFKKSVLLSAVFFLIATSNPYAPATPIAGAPRTFS